MAIAAPGPRLCASIPFSFIRAGRTGKKRVDASIALIPFIDFLLTVVVFLLMSFSAEGQIPLTTELPGAANGAELESAPVVSVDPSVITVDGRRVADSATLMSSARTEPIDPLVAELRTVRRSWEILHPHQPFTGRAVVQIDRSMDYRVVRKVLASLGQAGFAELDLAVRAR